MNGFEKISTQNSLDVRGRKIVKRLTTSRATDADSNICTSA